MAKQRMKKRGPQIRRVPDFRDLPPVIEWEQYYAPPFKQRPDKEVFGTLLTFGFDIDLLRAIIIANLIVKEVRAGLAGVNNKTPNEPALAEWRSLLQSAVYLRLKAGGNWAADGANVLAVARDMGTIAGLLSGSANQNPAGPNQLKSAFAASKSHTTCSAGAGIGGGAWCTFDWI